MFEALAPTAVFGGSAEIGGNACHPPGAQGFHPYLFDGVKNLAGFMSAGPAAAMKPLVVIAQAKSRGIRFAAQP